MITTRSLLPDLSTAFWTALKLHIFLRSLLISTSLSAFLAESFFFGWLGRRRKPFFLAFEMDFLARSRDELLQTTRTFPGPLPVTADLRERALGTSPPVGSPSACSTPGSGQYEGRSRWADATVGRAIAPSASAARMYRPPWRTLFDEPAFKMSPSYWIPPRPGGIAVSGYTVTPKSRQRVDAVHA